MVIDGILIDRVNAKENNNCDVVPKIRNHFAVLFSSATQKRINSPVFLTPRFWF